MMSVTTFEYLTPGGLPNVLLLLDELKAEKVSVLAGGTDLIPGLRRGTKEAAYVVDLRGAGLDHLVFDEGQARIGAMVTFARLSRHPEALRWLPALAEAAAKVGGVQTRTLATIGGNLCEAVPSNDAGPPLLAHDASVRLQAKGRERLVAVEEFFIGPRRTVLEPGEILTEIVVPLRADFRARFLRAGRRQSLTLSVVCVAAGVALRDGGQITTARIALGAVAPTPIRARKAERILEGRTVTRELLAEAAATAATETSPITDLRASAEYRRTLSRVLVRRALEEAVEAAREAAA